LRKGESFLVEVGTFLVEVATSTSVEVGTSTRVSEVRGVVFLGPRLVVGRDDVVFVAVNVLGKSKVECARDLESTGVVLEYESNYM
jgi:hypothetical protein